MAIEQYSQTWQDVKNYAEGRIAELRLRLESTISPDETLAVRAQLKELRLLLELPGTDIPITEPVDIYLPE